MIEAGRLELLLAVIKLFAKRFIVYLELNVNDSTIIRFHQIWPGEPPYYNVPEINNKKHVLYEYKSEVLGS
jgi:hypothetical protein